MSSIGTLYTTSAYAFGHRILAVAAMAGLKIDVAQGYTHYVDNKKPEFLAKFASGKIPALEMKDGFTLFESPTIARYVASLAPEAKLLGTNPKEAALVDQWMTFGEADIVPQTMNIQAMYNYVLPYNEAAYKICLGRHEQAFDTLEKHLSKNTFFVGERITLADIYIASILVRIMEMTFDASMRTKYPHLTQHFIHTLNEPKIKPCFGEIVFLETAKPYVPKAE